MKPFLGIPIALLTLAVACGGSGESAPVTPIATTPAKAATMQVLGLGAIATRFTGELSAHGTYAYTATWGQRTLPGTTIFVWDVSTSTPALLDSVSVTGNVVDISDVQVSDDGKLLMAGTEFAPGSFILFDLSDPRRPRQVSRTAGDLLADGVHTAKFGRVNGTLYAFVQEYPKTQPRIVIYDLTDPSSPKQVYTEVKGSPWIHDVFIRDGYLFLALWNAGMDIWDIGGGGRGSVSSPRVVGNVVTVAGEVHNMWWYHDATGAKTYVFVGQEGPGSVGSSSVGDIHVVDVSDMTRPREVAVYRVDNAGTHNFSVDEANGILYAAYYNGGVRAIDVRGDLGTCAAAQQTTAQGVTRCDLKAMGREMGIGLLDQGRPVYVWGVQVINGYVYASDMLNGLWKMKALSR